MSREVPVQAVTGGAGAHRRRASHPCSVALCPSSDDPDLRDLTVPIGVTGDGRPEIDVADDSLLAEHLARCPVVTVVVPARSPFRALHLTGATVPGGDAVAAEDDW